MHHHEYMCILSKYFKEWNGASVIKSYAHLYEIILKSSRQPFSLTMTEGVMRQMTDHSFFIPLQCSCRYQK